MKAFQKLVLYPLIAVITGGLFGLFLEHVVHLPVRQLDYILFMMIEYVGVRVVTGGDK